MTRNIQLFLFFAFLFFFNNSQAQIDSLAKDTIYWKRTVKTGFNINQASFSDNWKGGGVNSLAYVIFLNATADYKKERHSWNNVLELSYGAMNNQNSGYRKNVDRIYVDSKYGYGIHKYWNLFASINYLTQFDLGYRFDKDTAGIEQRTLISKFMAPGYLTESFGIEYKPVSYFYVRFGTGTLRQTFVVDTTLYRTEPKNYGVDVGKKVRNEVAFMLMSGLDKDVLPNINLKLKYMAFANYQMPDKYKGKITYFDYIDHRLDALITAKVNKYISTTLGGAVLYDYDQDKDVQLTQSLAIGVLFTY